MSFVDQVVPVMQGCTIIVAVEGVDPVLRLSFTLSLAQFLNVHVPAFALKLEVCVTKTQANPKDPKLKEENQNNTSTGQSQEAESAENNINEDENKIQTQTESLSSEKKEEINELTPEERIIELEDKIARAFAEMENQRRRFEKEKIDAFEYGGYSFAKEALSLIDN